VKYVIDSGLVKLNYFDVRSGVDSLICRTISKAAAKQRAGRAGRTQPGKCFRLMTQNSFIELPEYLPPEMQRTDISWAVLQLKSLGINDILHFDFVSPPPAEMMIHALELLYSLGALDENGLLTKDGAKMADFPIEPRVARCLMTSLSMGCSEEMLAIAAMCSVDCPFITIRHKYKAHLLFVLNHAIVSDWFFTYFSASKEAKQRLQECISEFVSLEGDHMTLFNIFTGYTSHNCDRSWCDSKCLQLRILQRAKEIRGNLHRLLSKLKGDGEVLASCQEDSSCIRRCLVAGYFSNAAQLSHDGLYRTIRGGTRVGGNFF